MTETIDEMSKRLLAECEHMQIEIYRLRELLQTISSTCDCWSAAEIRDKIRKELDRGEGKNVA